MQKIGFQGNHGTFSEIAAIDYFASKPIRQIGYPNFVAIMKDIENHTLDYAVLPVENTTTGIISRTYDLFKDYPIHAVGEINVPIRQDLIVVPGTKIEEIKEVYSHPEALSQCQKFFEAHPWMKQVPYQDTAKSVEYVKECNNHSKAALGSYRASEYYHMESLCTSVQDLTTNMTRFLVITWKEEAVKEANKTSLMLVVKHEPGSLYHVLEILASNKINMLKLESRPIPSRVFEYLFYVDIAADAQDEKVVAILQQMEKECIELKVFGSYKAARIENVFINK